MDPALIKLFSDQLEQIECPYFCIRKCYPLSDQKSRLYLIKTSKGVFSKLMENLWLSRFK